MTSPYARSGPISEYEILMEVHPFAALSHLTAMAFHGLTDLNPAEIHVTVAERPSGLPSGTSNFDWEGVTLVKGRLIDKINHIPIRWHRLKRSPSVGVAEYAPQGYPVRATDPEMTLIDGLLQPSWSGGIENVLHAWGRTADLIDVDRIVDHVTVVDSQVLRQRVGWILDSLLEISHPAVERWAENAIQGGSSKLVASEPFSPQYSEKWKLSLNAPIPALDHA